MEPRNRVAVPSHFYKILLHEKASGFIESMAVIVPHNTNSISKAQSKGYLTQHLVTIDDVEELAEVDFMARLRAENAAKEAAVEAFKAAVLWPTN